VDESGERPPLRHGVPHRGRTPKSWLPALRSTLRWQEINSHSLGALELGVVSLGSQQPLLCAQRMQLEMPLVNVRMHESLLILLESTKKRPLDTKLDAGRIEDVSAARDKLDLEGAVPVPVVVQRVELHLPNSRNIDSFGY